MDRRRYIVKANGQTDGTVNLVTGTFVGDGTVTGPSFDCDFTPTIVMVRTYDIADDVANTGIERAVTLTDFGGYSRYDQSTTGSASFAAGQQPNASATGVSPYVIGCSIVNGVCTIKAGGPVGRAHFTEGCTYHYLVSDLDTSTLAE